MKILITGICGFVGSTLARGWIDSGTRHTIVGIDNLLRPGSEINRDRLCRAGVDFHHGDLRFSGDLDALPGVDFVVDAAAEPSVTAGVAGGSATGRLMAHNLLGTVNILEYCRDRGAGLILLSTSRVYSIKGLAGLNLSVTDGAFHPVLDDPFPPGVSEAGISERFSTKPPVSLYGATKLAAETLAQEYGQAFGFPVWINRCGLMGGAGQFGRPDQGILSYWIHSWRQRRPLSYIGFGGSGHQVRDCLHPSDLLPLLEMQMSGAHRMPSPIQNVSGGKASAFSLRQISRWCRERFGPHDIGQEHGRRPYDIPWLVLDSGLALRQWDWKPSFGLIRILEEIADHADRNPDWLELSGCRP